MKTINLGVKGWEPDLYPFLGSQHDGLGPSHLDVHNVQPGPGME